MSQLEIDITEFILNNKLEIIQHIDNEVDHFKTCQRIFNNYPEIYEELLDKKKLQALQMFINDHFPQNIDNIYLIIDENFAKILK